jgi:hypothetical protein
MSQEQTREHFIRNPHHLYNWSEVEFECMHSRKPITIHRAQCKFNKYGVETAHGIVHWKDLLSIPDEDEDEVDDDEE